MSSVKTGKISSVDFTLNLSHISIGEKLFCDNYHDGYHPKPSTGSIRTDSCQAVPTDYKNKNMQLEMVDLLRRNKLNPTYPSVLVMDS